jgi:hypothetical protein
MAHPEESLDPELLARVDARLAAEDAVPPASARPWARQPVHTVYVPADRFTAATPQEWGVAALTALDTHGPLPGFEELTDAVRAKLDREPIEDLRIDLEDGYGHRPDEEDGHARVAATALAELITENRAPAFSGIRIKSLEAPTRARGLRSLTLFLEALCSRVELPPGWRVTVPKVSSVAQVEAFVMVAEHLESTFGLRRLPFELQIETPRAVLAADGTSPLPGMLTAAGDRCAGLHYGTYDYSAALGVSAAHQSLEHPVADAAKDVMQIAAAAVGVPVSDGSTNVLPVGDTAAVREAWALHARLVTRSLARGIYQGWDMHPAHLPTRFAATFAFHRAGLDAAGRRLRIYLDGASAGILDEPATARALAGSLLRALDSGAATAAEVRTASGLDAGELSAVVRDGALTAHPSRVQEIAAPKR